ncbi:MAG: potassium channel family protein [Planctomycetota bacterium]
MGAFAVIESGRRAFDVELPHFIVALVAAVTTILCVLVHYEAMRWGMRILPAWGIPRRARICGLILGLLLAHVIEVWLFALVYWALDPYTQLGQVTGPFDEGALDFVYFSVVTFSTLGFGDYVANGPITVLVGTEALVGLTFIAWTASIAFMEMQRDWNGNGENGNGPRG